MKSKLLPSPPKAVCHRVPQPGDILRFIGPNPVSSHGELVLIADDLSAVVIHSVTDVYPVGFRYDKITCLGEWEFTTHAAVEFTE